MSSLRPRLAEASLFVRITFLQWWRRAKRSPLSTAVYVSCFLAIATVLHVMLMGANWASPQIAELYIWVLFFMTLTIAVRRFSQRLSGDPAFVTKWYSLGGNRSVAYTVNLSVDLLRTGMYFGVLSLYPLLSSSVRSAPAPRSIALSSVALVTWLLSFIVAGMGEAFVAVLRRKNTRPFRRPLRALRYGMWLLTFGVLIGFALTAPHLVAAAVNWTNRGVLPPMWWPLVSVCAVVATYAAVIATRPLPLVSGGWSVERQLDEGSRSNHTLATSGALLALRTMRWRLLVTGVAVVVIGIMSTAVEAIDGRPAATLFVLVGGMFLLYDFGRRMRTAVGKQHVFLWEQPQRLQVDDHRRFALGQALVPSIIGTLAFVVTFVAHWGRPSAWQFAQMAICGAELGLTIGLLADVFSSHSQAVDRRTSIAFSACAGAVSMFWCARLLVFVGTPGILWLQSVGVGWCAFLALTAWSHRRTQPHRVLRGVEPRRAAS